MRKFLKFLIFLVTTFALAVGAFFGRQVADWILPPPRSTTEVLRDVVERENRKLPATIDDDTRLDRITLPAPNVLQNNYTLLYIDTPLPGPSATEKKKLREIGVGRTCSTPSIAPLLEMGIAIVYAYHTADGSFFASVTVTKADCRH
jgi:hypothetical protein